jgi:ankyrin repeat protein
VDSSQNKTSTKQKSKSTYQENVEASSKVWFFAAEKGFINKLKNIVKRLHSNDKENFLHITNQLGQTVLMVAARHGHVEMVDFLLNLFDEFDTQRTRVEVGLSKADYRGRTALMLAAQFADVETAEMLVNLAGVEPEDMLEILELQNPSGYDALAIAQKCGKQAMASFLSSYFAETQAKVENNSDAEESEEDFDAVTIPFPASPRVKFGLPLPTNNPVIFREMPAALLALSPAPAAPAANAPAVDETAVVIHQFLKLGL